MSTQPLYLTQTLTQIHNSQQLRHEFLPLKPHNNSHGHFCRPSLVRDVSFCQIRKFCGVPPRGTPTPPRVRRNLCSHTASCAHICKKLKQYIIVGYFLRCTVRCPHSSTVILIVFSLKLFRKTEAKIVISFTKMQLRNPRVFP